MTSNERSTLNQWPCSPDSWPWPGVNIDHVWLTEASLF